MPTETGPTRVLSPTPSLFPSTLVSVGSLTPVAVTPTVLVGADLVVLTSTLPPSKTPTATPTVTNTPLPLPPPTLALPLLSVPTQPSGIVPIPTPFGGGSCATSWFFANPPASCPLNSPLVSEGAFLMFQGGLMLWVGQQDAIYALYNDTVSPRWQVFNDLFVEGMPDTDPAFGVAPAATWQPRRGFGLLWRSQPNTRTRLGWATAEAETSYTVQVQISSDGTLYISQPSGGVFALSADGNQWTFFGR